MFYNDILPVSNQTILKVKLSNFSSGLNTKIEQNILPLNVATLSYNFDFNSGALVQGMGFKELTIDAYTETESGDKLYFGEKNLNVPSTVSEVKAVYVFRRHQQERYSPLLLIFADSYLYYTLFMTTLTEFIKVNNYTFEKTPIGINMYFSDDYRMVFCSQATNDSLSSVDGYMNLVRYNTAPKFFSLAEHAGRLFAVVGKEKDELWFSDDTNPCNWVPEVFNGGYIKVVDERGCINNLISHNNYLYLIRDYGISRLSGFGDETEFVIKNLSLSNSQIYGKTATLCGDYIFMLCKDGIYNFDGLNINKINLGFESLLENAPNQNAVGAFLDGKYYVACRLNFKDNETVGSEINEDSKNNCLIEYDINSGEYSILRGVNICNLTAIQFETIHKIVACFASDYKNKLGELTHDGLIFGTPTKKVWSSPQTDLGYPDKIKVLKNFYINTQEDIILKIKADDTTHTYKIKGSSKPRRLATALRASIFKIEPHELLSNSLTVSKRRIPKRKR